MTAAAPCSDLVHVQDGPFNRLFAVVEIIVLLVPAEGDGCALPDFRRSRSGVRRRRRGDRRCRGLGGGRRGGLRGFQGGDISVDVKDPDARGGILADMVFIRVPKAEGIVFLYAMLMRFGPLNDIESDAGRVVGQRRLNVHGELVVVRQGDADRVFESAAQLVNRAYAIGNENPLRLADAGGPAPLVYPSVPTVVPSAVKQNVIAALRAVQRLQPIVDPVNPQLFRINHDVADVPRCAEMGKERKLHRLWLHESLCLRNSFHDDMRDMKKKNSDSNMTVIRDNQTR